MKVSLVATAKSLQLCQTLCDPIDVGPPGSPAPGILQARTLEWVAIFFSNAWKWKSESEVAQSCPTLREPMDCSLPGSSLGISYFLEEISSLSHSIVFLCFFALITEEVFSCVVGRGCLLWPVHFLGKTLLVFALLHSVFQGQICLLLQVFLDFLLLHSSPL